MLSRLDRLGAIIDLAHISDPEFLDVIELYRGPVMCSHACARALHEHPRNITDEQARLVAERDGIVGVCFVGDFLGPPAKRPIEHAVDHIEHLMEVTGEDQVGIGPDWIDYALDILVPLNAGVGRPVDVRSGVPRGLEGPEGLPLLAEALERRGLPVHKVLGASALSFLRRALGGRP